MSAHLHLPHPHLADRFIEHIGEGFFAGMFHHDAQPARVDPEAVARWAQWLTPDEWEQRHRGGGR